MKQNNNHKKSIEGFFTEFKTNPDFKFVEKLLKKYNNAEIYLVGGLVRDIFLERKSYDYDFVVRNVKADELEKFLSKHGSVNLVGKSFGIFKFKPKKSKLEHEIDIALPRTEHSFNTGGHRDVDVQSDPELEIEKDLERRDFTMNAMALNIATQELVDPFNGLEDLNNKTIKTVGDAQERFQEDFLRMLRAIRFSTQLYFKIDQPTYLVIQKMAPKIKTVSTERIQEEFNKILMSDNAEFGIMLIQKSNLLKAFLPELEEGVGVSQNKSHIFEVFEHNAKTLGAAAKRNYPLSIRLAALFHDIAKPQTKAGQGPDSTFYNHDIVGAKKTRAILQRLKYSKETIQRVSHLVRHHMFFYSTDGITDAAIRRLLNRVGPQSVNELIQLRICDRLGMGRPKAKPFKLLELEKRLQEVQMDPITVGMLKIDGHDVMDTLKIEPSIRLKYLLEALLAEVLDDPKKNTKAKLIKRLKELHKLSDDKLKNLAPNFEALEQERKDAFFKKYTFVE